MILMMDQGSVVEQGTHAELMALKALLLPLPRRITVTVKSQSTINASREATSMTTNNGAAKSLTKRYTSTR